MSAKPNFSTIDEYLDSLPVHSRLVLEDIRRIARETVPEADETISYGIPALKLDRPFFYFAAFKKHIGVYPPVAEDQELIAELAPYRNEKGNLRFSLSEPLPLDLIRRVAAVLAAQYGR